MTLVTVTALRDFKYAGKGITAGAVFRMPALDAAIHIRQQNVSGSHHPGLDPTSLQPDPEPETEPEPEPTLMIPPRRKRQYRRRDLTAESP